MLPLRIHSWMAIIASFCFCQHAPERLSVVGGSSALSFFSAPFQRSVGYIPRKHEGFIPQGTLNPLSQNFGIFSPGDYRLLPAPSGQHLVAAATHHSGNNLRNRNVVLKKGNI